MHVSSPDQPKKPDAKSILLIGPPGGGKTTLAMQFPDVGIVNCDNNLDGPETYIRSFNPGLRYYYENARVKNEKELALEFCADRAFEIIGEFLVAPEIKTIFIDGLTYVNEFCLAKAMHKQNRTDEMQRQDWIPFRRYLFKILVKLRSAAKTTIMSCHEEILTKDIKGQPVVWRYRPAVSSKVTDYFGGFFTDIWRCTASPPVGGKLQPYKLQVMSDNLSDCKNSVGITKMSMDADWNELNKHLKL